MRRARIAKRGTIYRFRAMYACDRKEKNMSALLWLTVLATKLADWIRLKIDQRRNYKRFSEWLDAQRDPLAHIEELEQRHPAVRR